MAGCWKIFSSVLKSSQNFTGGGVWVLSGFLQLLSEAGMLTNSPRTVSNLAIFRKTLATFRSQVVLDAGRAVVAARIEV